MLTLLSTAADGRWHPGIGDPTPLGWATVFAYFAAMFAAVRASQHFRARVRAQAQLADLAGAAASRTMMHFWSGVAAFMALLGLNKQLDLQTFFTEVMRSLAYRQGWYAERQRYQFLFIVALALGALLALGVLALLLRRVLGQVLGASIGLVFIATFVLVRAVSFHHVDRLLGTGRIRLNWVLELSGIAFIFVSAMRATAPRAHTSLQEALRRQDV